MTRCDALLMRLLPGDDRSRHICSPTAAPCHPQLTRGMNGALLLTGGEACPAVVPAPFSLGPDLTSNAVVAAGFRLPPHQPHAPR